MTAALLKVVLHRRDLDASRRFYGDVLDLELIDEWEEPHSDGCVFRFGRAHIELNTAGHPDSTEAAAGGFELQFRVSDLDAWVDRLDGRWEHGPVKVQPWGERTVRLRDPERVLITIYETVQKTG